LVSKLFSYGLNLPQPSLHSLSDLIATYHTHLNACFTKSLGEDSSKENSEMLDVYAVEDRANQYTKANFKAGLLLK